MLFHFYVSEQDFETRVITLQTTKSGHRMELKDSVRTRNRRSLNMEDESKSEQVDEKGRIIHLSPEWVMSLPAPSIASRKAWCRMGVSEDGVRPDR